MSAVAASMSWPIDVLHTATRALRSCPRQRTCLQHRHPCWLILQKPSRPNAPSAMAPSARAALGGVLPAALHVLVLRTAEACGQEGSRPRFAPTLRVLLDDEPLISLFIGEMLAQMGRCQSIRHGRPSRGGVQRSAGDVALLDVRLPGKKVFGWAVAG
jgi:hypothetical protein